LNKRFVYFIFEEKLDWWLDYVVKDLLEYVKNCPENWLEFTEKCENGLDKKSGKN
jgi:hypothetical protein